MHGRWDRGQFLKISHAVNAVCAEGRFRWLVPALFSTIFAPFLVLVRHYFSFHEGSHWVYYYWGFYICIYIYREGPSDFLIYHFDVISLAVSSLEGKSLDLLLGGGIIGRVGSNLQIFFNSSIFGGFIIYYGQLLEEWSLWNLKI